MEWQPISTAPRDEWVLVYYDKGEMVGEVSIGCLYINGLWGDWDGDMYGTPANWMPLPTPPNS